MAESNRKRRTPTAKLAYWREQVAAWRESGLSRTAYCRRAGVSASSLGHWVRRLAREQDSRDAMPVVVAVAPQQLASALSDVRPGRVPLRLHVGERFQVDIAEDFAAPVLRRLLDVLAGMERSA